MNSDEDKFYMKIVAFDEIYSFVVQNFFIWSNIVSQKMIYYQISILYPYLGSISFLFCLKMTSNEKSLNYKVIDLIESYNFHINFTFIRIHTKKKLWFLKTYWHLRRVVAVGSAQYHRASTIHKWW
jgi:hypothetical protein